MYKMKKREKRFEIMYFSIFQLSGCLKVLLFPICCPLVVCHYVAEWCGSCFLKEIEEAVTPTVFSYLTESSPQRSSAVDDDVEKGDSSNQDDSVPRESSSTKRVPVEGEQTLDDVGL